MGYYNLYQHYRNRYIRCKNNNQSNTIQKVHKLQNGGQRFIIKSKAFRDGDMIPVKNTCDDLNISPELIWYNVPPKTVSLVLSMDDYDSDYGLVNHWILWNLDPDSNYLYEGYQPNKHVKIGLNDFGETKYTGPCPPIKEKPHRYVFKLYAIDIMLNIDYADKKTIMKMIRDHTIGTATYTAIYERD
jgi:hypothetical protein